MKISDPSNYDELIRKRDEAFSALMKANDDLSFKEYKCELCRFMNQKETSVACFNPKQDDKELMDYVYPGFGCRWFEKGDRLTDSQMEALGYKKIIDENAEIKEFFVHNK